MPDLNPFILKPWDVILYQPVSFRESPSGYIFDIAIAERTWHNICHVEVYIGNGKSVAARNGVGVNEYPLRTAQAAKVYRLIPTVHFDSDQAMHWFETKAKGQAYDWKGLLRFIYLKEKGSYSTAPHAMFCSEFETRFFANGGVLLFGGEDADAIAPFQNETTPLLSCVWSGV